MESYLYDIADCLLDIYDRFSDYILLIFLTSPSLFISKGVLKNSDILKFYDGSMSELLVYIFNKSLFFSIVLLLLLTCSSNYGLILLFVELN
jgi:hypothetical protein